MKIKITSENLGDKARLAGMDVNPIENQLGIRNAPVQLPKKGCGTVRLLDSEVHQIVYENTEPGEKTLRFQFLSYGNRVTISIELPRQPELCEPSDLTDLAKLLSDSSPNQSGRF